MTEQERRKAGDDEATQLLALLSVDQVARIAVAFRAETGSPVSSRNRFYLRAGRCAWLSLRTWRQVVPKDIWLFLAEKGRVENGRSY